LTDKKGLSPYFVAVTPDGGHVYVTNRNSDTVAVINTTEVIEELTLLANSKAVNFQLFIVSYL
jgi:YVTN family beta-propeller protein